jgi:AcrR family transcriptional regulator
MSEVAMGIETAAVPPRERILQAADELFYRAGIRAVGVDAIAEAAGTNKMTLYRHFPSKDALVAEYLRRKAKRVEALWERLEAAHPGNPLGQLHAWVQYMATDVIARGNRGCAHANAAVELTEKEHPARRVIEEFKKAQRERLMQLCRDAGLSEPELLADELYLVLEGARVSLQSVGPEDLGARMVRIGEAIIASHTPPKQ